MLLPHLADGAAELVDRSAAWVVTVHAQAHSSGVVCPHCRSESSRVGGDQLPHWMDRVLSDDPPAPQSLVAVFSTASDNGLAAVPVVRGRPGRTVALRAPYGLKGPLSSGAGRSHPSIEGGSSIRRRGGSTGELRWWIRSMCLSCP